MEDLNSWLRSAHFSKRVHHLSEMDYLQIPIIPLNSIRASTTMAVTGDHTIKTSFKFSSHIGLTGKMQVGFSSKASRTGIASKRRVVSEIIKKVKDAVRRRFVAPPTTERTGDKTVKSSLRPTKKSRWLKKCFNRRVSQVGVLDRSSETDWKPDLYELIRRKKMASKVRCPIHRANQESKEAN